MRALLLAAAFTAACSGESLSLSQTVQKALENYPSVRVSDEQLAAAASGISLARTAFLPRADVLGQINRATRNNIFGLMLPQAVIPSISGPVLGTNNFTNVWGSAVGFLVSWEPFDFGLRQANVVAAEASQRRAAATLERTRFEVSVLAADAYLTLMAAEQTLNAAKAQVARTESIDRIVEALVKAELRPGADASRNKAEVAIARTQVIQAEEAIRTARVTLRQLTGTDVTVTAGPLLQTPGDLQQQRSVASSPVAKEQEAAVTEAEARRKALDHAYVPKFYAQASAYARGSGANPDGTTGSALAGLGPDVQNWALGFTAQFSLMDLPSLRIRKEIEEHRTKMESARYDQLLADLNARLEQAFARLEAARRIAAELPVQLEAAYASEQQAAARYRSGLATLIEVADAQRVLTQTEIDDSLAKLSIWRAMLAVAAAQGDLQPFLESTK
jgi:outer membrane protein